MELENRRKLHTIQLAAWPSHQEQYKDTRQLPTRAHNNIRRNLKTYKVRKSIYKNSFYFKGSHWWNKMPNYIHALEDPLKLKKELTLIVNLTNICNE